MSLGPLMIGIEGVELNSQERELLRHPLLGGVILFGRNCESPLQLRALNEEIHALRKPRLLIAVDQEGGRVQRCRDGFTRLPALRALGQAFDDDPDRALWLAQLTGWLMAVELRAVGVDFSFAPVLDLDWGISGVIGDRAFHRSPEIVIRLARAYIRGMRRGGMAATGKHFPGHGAVAEDSHFALPIDERSFDEIVDQDLLPFAALCRDGLAAVMPAHVIYAQVDSQPAGFSSIWIRDILRGRLGFQGLVFSDDLDMQGAAGVGGPEQRVRAALDAGCDMALVCNDRSAVHRVLDRLPGFDDPLAHLRLVRMHGRGTLSFERLQRSGKWQRAVHLVQSYDSNPLLDLDLG